jgi:RNA exonuclease 4
MVFYSKKAKAEMWRRRKKMKTHHDDDGKDNRADNDSIKVNGQKRSADQMNGETEIAIKKAKISKNEEESTTVITIPAHLTSKEAKKFRKDARRKARTQGQSEDKLTFIIEGQEAPSKEQQHQEEGKAEEEEEHEEPTVNGERKKSKKKKEFPRINDILSSHASQKKLKEKLDKQNAMNNALPAAEKQKYIAIDCEMVGIGTDGVKSALARASVVNWDGEVLLDTFVRVPERVTDFRTRVSGVRAKDISVKNDDAIDHEECRLKVGELIMDKILVGHALKNDLSALMISHPRHDIRDTARYKPFMRATGRSGGKLRPRKLRDLVFEHLGMRIQVEGEAHCSIDDARASMELFKYARVRWEKELEKGSKGIKRGKK